ncbi:hypothetical protein QC761_0079460 [Podospora bellae-mahoneyi]|uniref:Amino acid permease/ SLC12A domain-containing protein n=1 Tax=Podospora bellae-mahoneyi TaxID=2093777 RepID=A0ABR0FFU5_9PEZI|nr:hypothetical protein QC761_0079460 [Podospora bellae-mahoneyi]
MFIILLIMMMFFLSIVQPRGEAYYHEPLGTRYWNHPYSFFNLVYNAKDENLKVEHSIEGSLGTLLGVWTTFTSVMFSYIGMDIVAATAAESRALSDVESMKMAARKINLRVITLYSLAMLTASFVVPMDHPFINGHSTSVGARSIFIMAVVEAGMPKVAHFFNAVFVFSAFTCGINSMYIATRVLHTLALRGQTGPEFITRRLRQCRSGVPVRAVLMTGAIVMVAYMGREGSVGAAASYDRDKPRYPYKSHGQWLKAGYGLVACVVLILFNGVGAFIEPFSIPKFIAAYISLPVFILLILCYNIRKHGFRFRVWWTDKSGDLSQTVQASSHTRKGRLEFSASGITRRNWAVLVHWVWVWLK